MPKDIIKKEMPSADDAAATEAKQIMDSIADKPDVCHMLYQMLDAKYESETGAAKEEKNPSSETDEYNQEGMPE